MDEKNKKAITKVFFIAISIPLFVFLISSFFFYPLFSFFPVFFLVLFTFLYNVVEDPRNSEGFFVAGLYGFWVDILSTVPIGFYLLTFLIFTFFFKLLLKKYVKIFSFS